MTVTGPRLLVTVTCDCHPTSTSSLRNKVSPVNVPGSADDGLAAHEGAEGFGELDRAVAALVRFDDADHHARKREAGAVQRMDELHLAVSVAEADVRAPCLEIREERRPLP